MNLDELRAQVLRANQQLPVLGLVCMHSGNVSGFDQETGTVFIKPSGVDYDQITLDSIVSVDIKTGLAAERKWSPSVDLPHHLFLYKHIPGIQGIVHTHSNYATAFAACGKSIPMVLTATADEFGVEIPCAPYVDNEEEHIGESILEHRNAAPAILLGNHGVFAWGPTPLAALKTAAMVEDVAKTVWLAMQLGHPIPISSEEAEKWHDRYKNRYGQTQK